MLASRIVLALVLLCGTARAGAGPADVGPYVSWSLTGWFPTDKLASFMKHADNGAQFALIVGARLGKHVAVEAFAAPPPELRGMGGGEGIGLQVQFPGRMFGLIIPAWFAAPFGFKGAGGIWTEATHEAYDLAPRDGSRAATEHFWRYAYGVAWGTAF